MLSDTFASKRVLITGHTGFKGSWLSEWLLLLGADVTGFSLPPPTVPALFRQLGLQSRLRHIEGDVRDLPALTATVREVKPDFIFHLAAQPLVRRSYAVPVDTYTTNVIGTVNLLEAIRQAEVGCVVVIATTDKCYENREVDHRYAEGDPLGGYDPYSSSKACAELAVCAYRRSFFSDPLAVAAIGTARAGNVLGGGDWAEDRILPDCIRNLQNGTPIAVRNPQAIRPWQHVLESLSGYLSLARNLAAAKKSADVRRLAQLCGAFNFGPQVSSERSVRELVDEVLKHWPGRWLDESGGDSFHEAGRLQLSIEKAADLLSWTPTWDFAETVHQTVDWYRESIAASSPQALCAFTRHQIEQYTTKALSLKSGFPV